MEGEPIIELEGSQGATRGVSCEVLASRRVVGTTALAKMRRRLPGSIDLVYDNYNAQLIGFSPTERASEAILSIAVDPRCFKALFGGYGYAAGCGAVASPRPRLLLNVGLRPWFGLGPSIVNEARVLKGLELPKDALIPIRAKPEAGLAHF